MRQTGKTTKKIKPGMIETLIGEKTKVEGTVQVSGTTRIDGWVKGAVLSDGTLIVGATGRLEGDGQAQNVLVAGKVCGNLAVMEKTQITSQGSVLGDVKTQILIIEEGAVFTGHCDMEARADAAADKGFDIAAGRASNHAPTEEPGRLEDGRAAAFGGPAVAGKPLAAVWTQDS